MIGGALSMPSFFSGELRRGLHVALRIAAVIGRAAGGKLALAVPRLRQHREMPQCVHLRALLAGIAAHHLVGVEGVAGAGNAHRGLGVLAQAAPRTAIAAWCSSAGTTARRISRRDWRDRSRSAARWRGRAYSPSRSRRPPARAGGFAPAREASRPTARTNSNGSKDAVHDALLATATGAGHCALPDHSGRLSCLRAGISSRFSRSIASARATRARVACGMITSSM